MNRTSLGFAALLSLVACKDKGGDTGPAGDGGADGEASPVSFACPGSEGCESAEGALSVGAASVVITPTCWELWEDTDGDTIWDYNDEPYFDCGCDHLCEGDEGWPGADEGEGDGEFQTQWMAGYDNAKPMVGVHDDLYARAIVFDQGQTRIALVVLDLVGFFYPDVLEVRQRVADAGLDVDHVIVSSTHTHEGPDTMGLWGKTESRSGVDPEYLETVRAHAVEAVTAAVSDLREVGAMKVGEVDISTYSDKGVYNILTDLRDPMVIDERMGGAAFWDTSGQPIATLAHFGEHPEGVADENLYLTSEFPSKLRETLESGVEWEAYSREGIGGTAIFVNGAVGGMMTNLRVTCTDPDGNDWRDYTLERSDVMGKVMGEMALDAIEGGEDVSGPGLALAVRPIEMPVENWGFQAMFLSGILDRELHGYDDSLPLGDDNIPLIDGEIDYLRVGPIAFYTIPGELFPEVNIGGYDGSHVGSEDAVLIDPENPNPPDVASAPAGPYMKERVLSATGATYGWIVGLGNDEVGYMLHEYDFELHETNPWFDEAEGDHYEETNSLGPETGPIMDAEIDVLLGWVSENF